MFLYVGDVWIDEVTSLQYSTMQNKTPLYGYASQLFNTTAPGQLIVQGRFTINYKEQGYLHAVLNRHFKQIDPDFIGPPRRRDIKGDNPFIGGNGTQISRASIERITSGDVTIAERYKFFNDLGGYATSFKRTEEEKKTQGVKDRTFEDIAEAFEDAIWKKDKKVSEVDNNTLNSQVRRTDHNKYDDFDIYVVFGNYAEERANHTLQKIIGVRLVDQSKTIQIDGAPIQEEYSFIARSVA